MKASVLVLMGIAVGCAAGAVGLGPARNVSRAATGQAVAQYCTDTGDFNNTEALDALVTKAGHEGWELIGVYRPSQIGATHADYVCFRRP
jgi:hypothetical protein